MRPPYDRHTSARAELSGAYVQRLAAAGPAEWDRPRDPAWTVRRIAEHAGGSWYAEQAGDLTG